MVKKICFLVCLSTVIYGCNVTDKGSDKVIVEGSILNSSLEDAPIAGLSVVLRISGGPWNYPVVAESETNNQGEFYLEYKLEDQNLTQVYVNDEPYTPIYSTDNFGIVKGESVDTTIKIHQNTSLVVHASTSSLEDGDRFCVNIPGVGVCEDDEPSSITTTRRAVGNDYNEVRFSLRRNGETKTSIDSVFCPIGETTEYEIEF